MRRLTRAELLAAVVAERWPDPAGAEAERPDTPEQQKARREALLNALPDYCPSGTRHQEASAA